MRPRPTLGPNGEYQIADGELPVGSTLGGNHLCVELLANGSIDAVHSIQSGSTIVRDVDVHHYDAVTGLRLTRRPGAFILEPESQSHRYSLGNGVEVEKLTFVFCGAAAPDACFVLLQARNEGSKAATVDSVLVARLKSSFEDQIEARWNESARALLVESTGKAKAARALFSSITPQSWSVTEDHARILAEKWRGAFDESVDVAGDDPLGVIHVRTRIEPKSSATMWFAAAELESAAATVLEAFRRRLPSAEAAHEKTRRHYEALLDKTVMLSPVENIDAGVRWAKANMLRVLRQTPTGPGFTNNPGHSTSCVGRDAAWFVYGCDWLDPRFSAALLRGFAARQEADGKIVEYYDLRTGRTCDDGLNVNDDTALFALAVSHHALATRDASFLEELYPAARRAIEQLLANRDERGLIFCRARQTGARGIVGWRNIIKEYRLSGATTELNSETYAALQRMAVLAKILGASSDAGRYADEAETLRRAIDRYLRNPSNGLYYLNIEIDGRPRSALSADLVFPVVFGVADDETSARIVQRLRQADFWTEAGIRTVPRDAPEYGPTRGNGLLGGVWVAATFWYAFAAAHFVPEIMAEALEKTFAHYARDPRATNTVPGEFSEWLHGETLANNGMMLSPWFPPRYLWAAIEGAAGLDLQPGGARITPRLPPDWSWLAVRSVPFGGSTMSWFVCRMDEMRLFATERVESTLSTEAYDRDVTPEVDVEGQNVAMAAFARGREVIVFLGNRLALTSTVAVRDGGAVAGLRPRRRYESLYGRWVELEDESDAYLVTIGRGSFALIEFA
ncbi:MAG TPA: hypothetical protein VHR97_11875 [Candidatus Baltobacteraceae bacterium]|nr:hypothetical protein [Candidatus Baltobacteraceae bacterium]